MMTTFADENISPVEETISHKTEVLDWSGLELESCDLEFRTDFHLGPKVAMEIALQITGQLIIVSLAAWFLVRPIAIWLAPLLNHTLAAVLCVVIGVTWAVVVEATRSTVSDDGDLPFIDPATLGRAFLPPILWNAVTLSAQLNHLAATSMFYLAVSLPFALLFFDRFATHVLYWITASQSSDYFTKSVGRDAWARRLSGPPNAFALATAASPTEPDPAFQAALNAIGRYRWGVLWLGAATLAPLGTLVLLGGHAKSITFGLQLVCGALFGLLFAVLLRTCAEWRVVPLFFRMLVHWFYFGWKERLAPWGFRSPCGSWISRQFYVTLAVGLLAVPLTSMAAHSFAGLLHAAEARSRTVHSAEPLRDETRLRPASSSQEIVSSTWLSLAPTALVCLSIPPLCFCLIGVLLTGNLIVACHDAFESSLGVLPESTLSSELEDTLTANDEREAT